MSEKEHTRLVKLVTILCALLALLIIGGAVAISFLFVKTQQNSNKIDAILNIKQIVPKDGQNGLNGKDAIAPLPVAGKPGSNGLDARLPVKGVDYFDGKDAQPCTTKNDENGDMVQTCPDGSTSKITQPTNGYDARQIEACYRRDGSLGWRYAGDVACKVIQREQ